MAPGPVNGLLNIAKDRGPTSHDIVDLVRRAAGIRRVGHAGTLDPAAAGVLPVLVGRVTRLARFFGAYRKRYQAVIRLGIETDTCDAEGTVIARKEVRVAVFDELPVVVAAFIGDVPQEVPAYAAVKSGGRPLYEQARRGDAVTPPTRTVSIYQLEIVSATPPTFTLLVECGGGTYVRALARDIGRRLEVGGHLEALTRLGVGPFTLDDALPESILREKRPEMWGRPYFTAAAELLPDLPAEILSPKGVDDFLHGRPVPVTAWLRPAAPVRFFAEDGILLGIGAADGAGRACPDTVLVNAEDLLPGTSTS